MNKVLTLDLVDVYIMAMLGQGFFLVEISTAIGFVPAAATQRLNRIKRVFPDFCVKTKGRHAITPRGQHLSDASLNFLEQLSGGKVRLPAKSAKCARLD
jgi:hypothetical protein